MAEPVNLNRFRKAKERAESKARADTNSVKFGRGKAERDLDRARKDKARRDLDAHKGET
ncbi:DUF4169 family protein [Sedimentitalea nanhaiensis]|uniref:DUF4169 domain-containing protein n=1 Tax=Sedimentitalea nanhaiensis TaxID=999627 RepID=A0A1I7DZT4_9RHOB|nr:DUF4169 family protein [Sedimentitalea nanhaiensis]SFU17222.1 protein of unknown function [Sedimentitalea nanhaiensis]